MNLFHGTGALDGDVCLHLPHELQGLGDGEPLGYGSLHSTYGGDMFEYDSYVLDYSFTDSFTEMQCNDSC